MKLLFVVLLLAAAVNAVLGITITNFANVGGTRFATLDNADPLSSTVGCQKTAYTVPAGWALATETTNAVLAVKILPWSTQCLVFADGKAQNIKTGSACGTGQLSGSASAGYKPKACNRRVLITQAGQAGDVDLSKNTVPTKFIVVNRMVYAAIDGTDPASTTEACQTRALNVPSGWSLAADDDNAHTALVAQHGTYGTTCVVLGNGNAYYPVTGLSCGTGLLVTVASSYYVPLWCNIRVLISRPATASEPDTFDLSARTITNTVTAGGLSFATIDNWSATDASSACQQSALPLPSGWSVATPGSAVTTALQTGLFGTSCFVLADGSSVTHSGTNCGGTAQLVNFKTLYGVNWCDQRVLIQSSGGGSPPPPPPPPPPPGDVASSIGLKILILSTAGDPVSENQLGVALQSFTAMGIPYDVWAAKPTSSTPASTLRGSLVLTDGTSTGGLYQGFVATTDYLVNSGAAGTLPAAERTKLQAYMRAFKARLVTLYAFPSDRGVSVVSGYPSGSGVDMVVQIDSAYGATQSDLVPTMNVHTTGIWFYPAQITDASTTTAIFDITKPNGASLGVGAVIYNDGTGFEELRFFFDQATWSLHSSVVSLMWVPWVTHGVYIGSRRIQLTPQIDDLFLDTEIWDNTKHDSVGPAVRVSAADWAFHADFIDSVNNGNDNLFYTFAFNGQGVSDAGGPNSDALYQKVKALQSRSAVRFESHTYTHRDLTIDDATGKPTTYANTLSEVTLNMQFANSLFTAGNPNYDPAAMVTPGITGLFNPNALRALKDGGIQYVVGDNSVTALQPSNPYHGIQTTVAVNGYQSVYIVPRFPTDINYDCPNPTVNAQEYNYRYKSYWGRNLGDIEIIQNDANRTVNNLLAFRHDPYMFHQANCITFTALDPQTNVNTKHSLLTLWTRYVLVGLRKYTNLPVYSMAHKDMYRALLEREARDACQASGRLNLDSSSRIVSIDLTSTGTCKLGITGIAPSGVSGVTVETYGNEKTAWVNLVGAATNIPLSTPVNY